MKYLPSLLLLGLLCSHLGYGADFNFGPTADLTYAVTKEESGQQHLKVLLKGEPVADLEVKVIPKGTKFYHWTSNEGFIQMATQNGISEKHSLALLRNTTKARYAVGDGTYVARDPTSSIQYGNKLLEFTSVRDAILLEETDYELHGRKEQVMNAYKAKDPRFNPKNAVNRELWKSGLDGVGYMGGINGWLNFFNAEALGKARLMAPQEIMDEFVRLEGRSPYSDSQKRHFLTYFSTRFPLKTSESLRKLNPLLDKIVRGEKLGPGDQAEITEWRKWFGSSTDNPPIMKLIDDATTASPVVVDELHKPE